VNLQMEFELEIMLTAPLSENFNQDFGNFCCWIEARYAVLKCICTELQKSDWVGGLKAKF